MACSQTLSVCDHMPSHELSRVMLSEHVTGNFQGKTSFCYHYPFIVAKSVAGASEKTLQDAAPALKNLHSIF